MTIIEHLPKLRQIIPVYAVIVMMIYGWTIYWYFWEIPSWIYFLSPADILRIYAYALSLNFLESLAVLFLLLVICILSPRSWFYQSFVARASVFVILLLGYLMYFSNSFKSIVTENYPRALIAWTPAVFVVIAILVFVTGRLSSVSRWMEEFSSRAVIFLYISIPASIFSLLYVAIRNLFWRYLNG